MVDIPVIVTSAGAQPTPPATLLAQLIASVSASNPGYTANLGGSLVEDITSTDVAAIAMCDTARVETINSLTPLGSNLFLLAQLGEIYIGPGAAPAVPTNTSVFVTFNVTNASGGSPAPGYSIPIGFTVSDGTYQYIVQDNGVTDSNGNATLFCQAAVPGSWSIAPGTVTNIITSVPSAFVMTSTNALAGTSGAVAETAGQYRARVLQAGQAVSQGMTTMLRTLLGLVPGVQQRLISIRQQSSLWEVICGGGDPYLTAGAIFESVFDISTLTGSTLNVLGITQASPGVVQIDKNHNYQNGQVAQINGVVGMTQINGLPLTITVVDQTHFSVGISTLGYSAYASGGVVTPNLRNVSVNVIDYPDAYSIVFVNPPAQTVTMTVAWNTIQPNFVAQASVAQAAAPAIADYINSIVVGQPINLFAAQDAFIAAVSGILPESALSRLTFTVLINGVVTAPDAGTQLVRGDPESYFTATAGGITVNQA